MKTYWAVITITKLYKPGYGIDQVLWQKPCRTKKEAEAFITRLGDGKPGLYSVDESYIEVDESSLAAPYLYF